MSDKEIYSSLSVEDKEELERIRAKDIDDLSTTEVDALFRITSELQKKIDSQQYKKRPKKKRVEDHQKVLQILGGYTAFITAACLTIVSRNHVSAYDSWALSLWAISLPFLTGTIILDHNIRVNQKRPRSRTRTLLASIGLVLSQLGTTVIIASYSWVAAVVFCLSALLVLFYVHEVTVLGGRESFEEL